MGNCPVDTLRRGMDDEELGATKEAGVCIVGTQEALASHLGFDRKTVQRWMKLEGCPARGKDGYDVGMWRAWTEAKNLGKKKSRSKAELDAEKVALQNERQRLLNAKLRGEMTTQDEVIRVLGDMLSGFVLTLTQSKTTIAEEASGVSVGEATKRIDHRHKEVLATLALGEWAKKKPFWSRVYAELSSLRKIHVLGLGPKNT